MINTVTDSIETGLLTNKPDSFNGASPKQNLEAAELDAEGKLIGSAIKGVGSFVEKFESCGNHMFDNEIPITRYKNIGGCGFQAWVYIDPSTKQFSTIHDVSNAKDAFNKNSQHIAEYYVDIELIPNTEGTDYNKIIKKITRISWIGPEVNVAEITNERRESNISDTIGGLQSYFGNNRFFYFNKIYHYTYLKKNIGGKKRKTRKGLKRKTKKQRKGGKKSKRRQIN